MRRYFKFLTTSLIACVLTIACVNELDLHQPINESEFYTTLVPRVEGFANQYITKSSYETSEQKITKLAILVFNEDEDGKCIHLQESENGGPITLNKSMLNSPEQSGKLDQAIVVMIANIGTDKIVNGEKTIKDNWSNLTFSDLENYSFQYDDAQTIITSLGDEFIGFPMIGASKVDLTSTKQQQAAIEVKLKILYAKIKFAISVENGTENEGSGMSFTLNNYSVFNASKQTKLAVPTNQGEPTMSFEEFLLGQPVSESAQPATESSATESASYAYNHPGKLGSAAGSVSVGGDPISFTFYVSESRFNHGLGIEQLADIYPDGWTTTSEAEDVKDYTEEDDKNKLNGVKYFYDELAQQYKPLLAQSASGKPAPGLATYVLLNGSYKDYRGEIWNVNYKVYLGKDNSQNFQVDRNSCYTNNIVIKGIRNNDDTDAHGEVWIDHRVDVEIGDSNSAADHITITRETLIDSHIEVRPLRVSWPEGEYAFARVYLPFYQDNGTTWSQRDEKTSQKKNWIGIELGDKTGSLYCSGETNPAKGKRKYFTDALVSELNLSTENTDIVALEDGKKFIALANKQCAWIYIDEYWNDGATSNTPATADRKAKIVVDFCKIDNDKINVLSTEEYILYQQPLINIGQGKYYVENYEEYLHSYDSYDNYNISSTPADYTGQGLPWGYFYLDERKNHVSKSQFVTKKPLEQWTDWTPTNNEAYDFVHSADAESLIADGYRITDKDGKDIDLSKKNNGYDFTYSVSANNAVTISSMGEMPESAYQYCLSKNKFREGTNGQDNEMLIRWYVPDVYELSEIFASENSPLSNENYYWSSQVPYNLVTSGLLQTNIASEDIDLARLVSKNGEITDDELRDRSKKHRIRCLYNRDGKTANMDGRTPEGIGGLMKIPMTVENKGFFNYEPWITDVTGETTDYPDPLPTYRFPMGDTYEGGANDPNRQEADEDFGGVTIDGKHYYTKNPLDQKIWAGGLADWGIEGYYVLIHEDKWPGLTSKVAPAVTDIDILEDIANFLGISSICTLSDEDKEIQRSETTRSGKKIESMPSNIGSVYLDHNEPKDNPNDPNKLKISFGQGTNTSNTPSYEYYNEDSNAAKGKTWVKKWEVPKYSKSPIKGEEETFTGEPTNWISAGLQLTNKVRELQDKGYTIVSYDVEGSGRNCYYVIIAYRDTDGYQYTTPGGWGDETIDEEKSGPIGPAKPNVDALTFYAGNTFTITAEQGYYIRSVKVNFNNSTIQSGKTYLRLVDNSKDLPDTNKEPEQMTYLDGTNGWSKWTSVSNDISVTLRLVICDMNTNSWWYENWGDPKMTHKDPSTSEQRNQSLIIESLEIRLEKVEETNN